MKPQSKNPPGAPRKHEKNTVSSLMVHNFPKTLHKNLRAEAKRRKIPLRALIVHTLTDVISQ